MTASPNRVDAATIRAALKAAGVTVPVRITSGRNTTYIARLDRDSVLGEADLEPAEAELIAGALRPLWNDERVRLAFGGTGVRVARAGWSSTAPLEAELEQLAAAGVHPGRVAELREDSTVEERVAELGEVLTDSLAMPLAGGHGAAGVTVVLGPEDALYSSHDGGEWQRCTLVGLDPSVARYRLARELLRAVSRRRRPIRRPVTVTR